LLAGVEAGGMRIGVGSGNPVKRRAVESVVEEGDAGPTVEAVAVDSGVSEQPTGHAETVAGAENRARNALAAGYDLGVGIEGGVAGFDGAPGLYLVMWAAAADGRRLERGAGPAIRLPVEIAERVRDGEELGPVMDDVLDETGVARGRGASGAFTSGRITRTEALGTAVAGALGPFETDLYR
jgi:inosine/xanthosine triphosphatase